MRHSGKPSLGRLTQFMKYGIINTSKRRTIGNGVDRNNIDEVAKAISALNLWKRTSKYNWALVSELFDKPLIAVVNPAQNGPIMGRLMLFNGFVAHRDFQIFCQNQDLSFALSPLDIDHYEVIGLKDGGAEVFDYRPGFVPVHPDADSAARLAPVIYECYGLMMRFDEDPELPVTFKDKGAMFARREGLDGRWTDVPLKPPNLDTLTWTERVGLDRAKCAKGARLDMEPDEAWEVEFVQVPAYRTGGKDARMMFLFAAVDSKTGRRHVWQKLAVDAAVPRNGTLDALKPLWESLAAHLLDGVLRRGKVPGSIHLRTQRMMRFLRPLGMQIPFKMVMHGQLPQVTSAINRALLEHSI